MASTVETHLRTQPISTSSAPSFDCSICLDVAVDPVVTLCGHLNCWPCIYKWLHRHHHHHCPVCNGPLSTSSLVPIYGRGDKPSSSDPTVPRRPRRAKPEPARVELRGGFVEPSLTVHSNYGGAAVAAMGLRCTEPYLDAYGGSGAAAEEVRSLQRITGFLLCGVLLCLLLF